MRKYLPIFALALFVLASCSEKDYYVAPTPDEIEGNLDFDWKTTNEVNFNLSVAGIDENLDKFFSTVKVYTESTMDQASLIAVGGAKPAGNDFNTKLSIPTYVKNLYVSVTDGAGREKTYTCEVSGKNITLDTSVAQEITTRSGGIQVPDAPTIIIPDLNTLTVLTNETKVVQNGSYLVPAGTHLILDNNDIMSIGHWTDKRNAKIYVAGTLEIKPTANAIGSGRDIKNRYITVLNGGEIIGERLVVTQVHNNSEGYEKDRPAIYVQKGGKINVTLLGVHGKTFNEVLDNGIIANHGEIDCERLHLYENTVTHNAGRITVHVRSGFSKNAKIIGYPGSLTESTAQTHTSAQSDQTQMWLYPGSIFHIGGFDPDKNNGDDYSSTVGWGTYNTRFYAPYGDDNNKALLIISTSDYRPNNINNRRYVIEGPIDVHIPNLTNAGYEKMIADGSVDETIHVTKGSLIDRGSQNGYYIAKNEFNRGYGIFEIPDSDGDGVPEGLDVDDNDPEVAYHSFFPSPVRFATVMFEDQWPSTGDYDMNDLVLNFRVEYVTNTNNEVVRMHMKWRARAAGATHRIGFAMQLDDIAPSEILEITAAGGYQLQETGNGFGVELLEAGQSKAVIPFFNDYSHIFGKNSFVNTINFDKDAPIESYSIIFLKNGNGTPVKKARLLTDKLNPFIIVNGRATEIHLPGFSRTDKGTVFNGDENIDNFKNTDGMMWAIMTPQSISYTVEEAHITKAYTRFKEWYKSGGTEYADWYSKGDYKNADNLRKEPYAEFH